MAESVSLERFIMYFIPLSFVAGQVLVDACGVKYSKLCKV
jgi:hypothetical protein